MQYRVIFLYNISLTLLKEDKIHIIYQNIELKNIFYSYTKVINF